MDLFVLALLLAGQAADEPTWARDVAPILHRCCTSCHRPGETAPFPLLSFEDAAGRARQIAVVTKSRVMPPWLAEPSDPPFVGVRRLADQEIETLARWAAAGAPSGDLASAPPPPPFTPGWQIGVPDLVVTMAEPFVVPAGGIDLYRNFVIPVPVETLRYVRAVELRPGNPRVVHHAVIKLDRSDSSRRLDAKDPLPGFEEMETGEAVSPDGQFLGWTPGRTPRPLPEGMAWRLPPGADLVVQLHLLPSGKPEPVQVSVGLFFAEGPPRQIPFIVRLGCQAIDIPAGADDYVLTDRFTLPVDVDLCALAPHSHFLGRSAEAWATLPDGTKRTLVEVRRWNFSWQDEFRYEQPVPLPAGTELSMRWSYDNSDKNPRNPRQPPQRVRFGASSLEEMCDVWVQVVPRSRADFETLVREHTKKDLAMLRAGFEMRLSFEPDDPEAHLDLGLAFLQQGEIPGARRELERTIELAPRHARARFQLAGLLDRLPDAAGARAQYEQVVALEPDHAGAWNELGVLAEKTGDFAAATRDYERAVASRPKSLPPRVNLARMRLRRGDDAAAGVEFEAALALDPAEPFVRRSLAWLRATSRVAGARDGRRALELARDLVAAAQDDPALLDLLGAAQAESGRFKAAVDTMARAIELARRRGNAPLAAELEKRRDLYSQSRPWREPAPAGANGSR